MVELSKAATEAQRQPYPRLLVAVVLALLLLLAIASLGGYRDLAAARQRQDLLETKIEATQLRNEELARRIERLQNDPAALEHLAREQYRMMRPEDVVIILPEEPERKIAAQSVAD